MIKNGREMKSRDKTAKRGRITIITGLSGSGKTTALNALEDQGFFCIDNLPVLLLTKLLAMRKDDGEDFLNLAVVMDMREEGFIENFPRIFKRIKKDAAYDLEMIFLEASNEALVRAFSYTRRPHPLAHEGTKLLEAIKQERDIMTPVRDAANITVDTTNFNAHQLRSYFIQRFAMSQPEMSVEFISFGYRYGLPREADIVMDVRFLPNPYYQDSLRELNGTDAQVKKFVCAKQESVDFLGEFYQILDHLIPLYNNGGKSYLTVAIGCTGGQHRSVAIAEELAGMFKGKPYTVTCRHRDI